MNFNDKRKFPGYHYHPLRRNTQDLSYVDGHFSPEISLNSNNSHSFYSKSSTTVASDSVCSDSLCSYSLSERSSQPARIHTFVNLNQSSAKPDGSPRASKRRMSSIYNGRKRRRSSKKARTGLLGFIIAVVKSDPGKYWLLKAIFAFPLGLLISLGLYITVVMPMDMEPENREFVGSASGLLLSLGFAFSVQIRCITLLVLPTFLGRAGRTYIAAFAIIFLVAGPIKNLIDNFREVARSLSCMAQLLANHTLTKWKLRLSPLKDAIEELQEEGFLIGQIGSVVEQAFAPLRREMEDQAEVDEMEQDIEEVEAIVAESQQNGPPPNPFSVKQIEEKHKLKPGEDEGEVVEDKWAKKLDLRCDDVFSRAILKCRDWFGDMEEKCMDALWLLGYILCLPLKMTFFCDLMRVISGALGMDCDSFDVVDPGVGGTYTATRDMVGEVENGMKVNLQYRLVGPRTPLNFISAEEIKAGVMNEYESKAQWVNFLLLICKRLLTFTFLLVFKEAYDYQKGFLTNFQHDNVYVTSYFRRIDARRKAAGKKKLLPLKRSEKQQMIFPTNRALMARETRDLKPGTAKLVFQAFVSVIIMYIDFLFVWVLNVIKRNSKIEYHQQGEQYVKIDVFGTGFMASIVRMFLTTFNSHHKLDSITSNEDCLPRATPPSIWKNARVMLIYLATWLFMLSEAYGLRLRRAICAFFYRKREKRRVLYVYNELLKKRKGYLRHMRHRVRKQIRDRTLETKTSVINALKLQFPRLCWCLRFLAASKDTCLVCKDPEGKDFVRCQTVGCNWGYCKECWGDIKRKCYACGGKEDDESGSDSDESSTSESSELTDDENFLH